MENDDLTPARYDWKWRDLGSFADIPAPTTCGKCHWFCRECRKPWTCVEEGYCRAPGLELCPSCWDILGGAFIAKHGL